ncbi:hypothetical protein ESCO_002106 [Escovopsis weberi]|uniref:Uncharacterized protein n=1 Tax=Escovopsis weberi TaxID=150374 RepID=A0A0M8N7P1_ESCWE|nr:hypothetical protein ESCO_002106 [Escovopsis weberi]
MIFERLPLLGNPDMPLQLLADFALHMISLWTRCYEEQLWPPIKFLVSLIAFTFQLNTSFVVPQVFKELIPVAQASVFLVAEGPQRLQDGTITNADEYNALEQHIDTSQILSLLYTTAQGCATTPAETEDGVRHHAASMFWELFSFETVRLLLAPKQRFADIVETLELIGTSSLPDSIGPIVDGREAAATASAVIDRVSAKLTEHSRAPNTPWQKRCIRDAALRALVAFARHPFGARQLASHRDALPRLVVCLSTSIDDLYDQPLSLSALPPLPKSLRSSSLKIPESTAFPELYHIISQCVLLMHALITDPLTAELADISGKLAVCHGGHQRYLIALGRLTFAEEDLVLEAGIEGEIVEAAHELLEMAVTPERGEFVSEAFGA